MTTVDTTMHEPSAEATNAFEQILEFDTPENVVFGYIVAGIGSRFLAAFLDTVLIVMLQVVANLTLLLAVALIAGESLSDFAASRNLSLLAAVFGLLSFAFLWGYYIFFELLWNGQSPGKRWIGLRVIQQNGRPIDVAAALIRNLVRIVDFLPLYYGVGVLSMFIDRQSRRLGDFAASTVVVYDRGALSLQDLALQAAQVDRSLHLTSLHGMEGLPSIARSRLKPAHVSVAREFLGRQHELYNRGELALFLAHRILADLEAPADSVDEEKALALLKAVAGHDTRPATPFDSAQLHG